MSSAAPPADSIWKEAPFTVNQVQTTELRRQEVAGDAEAARVPAVEVHDLSVAYQKRPVIWGIDFQIPAGQLVGLVGPNGAGKSTLIKAILGLVPPQRVGEIFGRPYARQRRRRRLRARSGSGRLGLSHQRPRRGADGPLRPPGAVPPPGKGARHGLGVPGRVGMADFAHRQISQLSGGQQQRVFLARALAQDADVYFMDEPLAGRGRRHRTGHRGAPGLLRDQGKTVVVVHHDLQTVPEYFDWVLLLNMRLVAAADERRLHTGEPAEDVRRPADGAGTHRPHLVAGLTRP